MADIGTTLFVDLLGMNVYPGAPFTGNIYRDIIMFLIVPTIFIIMVLYIASGRVIPNRSFRIMLGVGAYLFIIAGGYYSFFALLAGPYFIFLIFILGILGYLGRHFQPAGGYSRGAGYSRGEGGGNYAEYSGHGGGFKSGIRAPKIFGRAPLEDEYVSILQGLAISGGKAAKNSGLIDRKIQLEVELFGKHLTKSEIKRRYGIEL